MTLFIYWLIWLFCSLSATLFFILSACPHWHNQNTVKGSLCGRERERLRSMVLGCYLGITVKRSIVNVTWHPFSKAHFKACFALVLSTFGRGEERGWSSLWALLGLYPVPLLSMFPLSSPLALPNCLCACCITTLFCFHPILLPFVLLTSHFPLASSAFFLFLTNYLFFCASAW